MPNSQCFWCGRLFLSGRQRTRDHLVPASVGGQLRPSNVVLACRKCNRDRGRVAGHFGDQKVILALVRGADRARAVRLADRFCRRAASVVALQAYWRRIEQDLLGFSPTGDLAVMTPGEFLKAAGVAPVAGGE